MRCSGDIVIGSTIMPDSERLTLSTSAACAAIGRFLWTMPMPPFCAMQIAVSCSVTVSIAAETSGMLSAIVAREARAQVDVARAAPRTRAGHEQDVVEGEALADPAVGGTVGHERDALRARRIVPKIDGVWGSRRGSRSKWRSVDPEPCRLSSRRAVSPRCEAIEAVAHRAGEVRERRLEDAARRAGRVLGEAPERLPREHPDAGRLARDGGRPRAGRPPRARARRGTRRRRPARAPPRGRRSAPGARSRQHEALGLLRPRRRAARPASRSTRSRSSATSSRSSSESSAQQREAP